MIRGATLRGAAYGSIVVIGLIIIKGGGRGECGYDKTSGEVVEIYGIGCGAGTDGR